MFIYQRQVPLLRTSSILSMPFFIKKHKHHATISTMTRKNMSLSTFFQANGELLGWIGTSFVIGSYVLLSLGIIQGNSYTYHSLVLVGSFGVALISYLKKAHQPFVINAFFVAIAIIALIRLTYFT